MIGVTSPGGTAALAGRHALPDGRQDRHRAGVHGRPEREVPRGGRRRAPARPRAVHRVCARRTRRNSRSPCWSRTGAAAAAPRRRSRARSSTPTCCRPRRQPAPRRRRRHHRLPQERPRNEERDRGPGLLEPRPAHVHADRAPARGAAPRRAAAARAARGVRGGLVVLYSAPGEDLGMFLRQAVRVALGFGGPDRRRADSAARDADRRAVPLHDRRGAADRGRGRRRRREGRAALARSRFRALPAFGAHEARGAARVRVVPARAAAAAGFHDARGRRVRRARADAAHRRAARPRHRAARCGRRRARDPARRACSSAISSASARS